MTLLQTDEPFSVFHGDCIPHMREMPESSVDLSVFSPPFPALYAYTDSPSDLGNAQDLNSIVTIHFSYFFRSLARIIKPGRVVVVHVAQIARQKREGGETGLYDFRGLLIRLGERAGLTYEFDWLIRKNPQSQAIRTRSRQLQFTGLENDRANSRGAIGDYLIKFKKPGENAVPVDSKGEVSRDNWISWAEGFWDDIRETDTLNTAIAKSPDDTRHICPLQLGVIDRIVRLFSNPGEIVFSPFAGIGSEGYMAIKRGRRFYGCELKPEYYAQCVRNLETAISEGRKVEQESLFAEQSVAS